MPVTPEREFIEMRDRAEWRAWLAENGSISKGVWLAVGKKSGNVTSLTYEQAVEEALAFGWIDSTVNRLDEHRFIQLFTPRKATSSWAPSNKQRVERLLAEGRMTPAGIAAVELAKSNGTWESLDDSESMVVPEDLAVALATIDQARAGFDSLTDSAKKMTLWWIASAKRPETRARRIAATAEAAARGESPR